MVLWCYGAMVLWCSRRAIAERVFASSDFQRRTMPAPVREQTCPPFHILLFCFFVPVLAPKAKSSKRLCLLHETESGEREYRACVRCVTAADSASGALHCVLLHCVFTLVVRHKNSVAPLFSNLLSNSHHTTATLLPLPPSSASITSSFASFS